MGLSTVTPRAFNSTGSQSICRANAPNDDVLIESQFLTQCNMEYINGTGETFVRGTLNKLPTTSVASSIENQDIFNLESDVDAISDISLSISLDFATQTDSTLWNGIMAANAGANAHPVVSTVTKDFLLSMINRIEIRVGGLTIQTILPEEIFMRNLTEQVTTSLDDWLSNCVTGDNKDSFNPQPSGIVIGSSTRVQGKFNANEIRLLSTVNRGNNIIIVRDGTRLTWSLSLPFTGRSNNMRNCFLQAGAVSNSISISVFYNSAFPSAQTGSKQFAADTTASLTTGRGVYSLIRDFNFAWDTNNSIPATELPGKTFANTYRSWLTVKNHTFTDTESNFVQQNIINRIITASQSVSREIELGETSNPMNTPRTGISLFAHTNTIKHGIYTDLHLPDWSDTVVLSPVKYTNRETIPITVDLSNFDLIASHLLIGAFASVHNTDGSLSVPPLELTWKASNYNGTSWDPFIDYSDFTATTADPTHITPIASCESLSFTGYSLGSKSKCITSSGSSIRGILDNWLDSVEVRIGNDTTGRLPASSLLKTGEQFGLTSAGGAPIFVVPLADKPFSTAGIPMARVGTKQVILHVDRRYLVERGPFTQINGSYDNPWDSQAQPTGFDTGTVHSWSPITKVSVVGVGTRVQTTVGGTTSFAS